jgi:hypothetical protein
MSSCAVRPTNPFDPETPPQFQQRATLQGRVRAIVAPDAVGVVPAPGACDDVDGGDDSGFIVVLRGLADTGDSIAAFSSETNEGGGFRFVDVPAGGYVLEVRREGFAVPDPLELTLAVGEARTLATVCAVNETAPAAPLVVPPPALVDAENRANGSGVPVALTIQSAPDTIVHVRESPDGAAPTRDEPVDGSAPVPLVLDPTPGVDDDDVRRVWRIDVTAVDPLGNTSAPVSFLLTKDGEAPAAPTPTTLAGLDRVVVAPGVIDGDVVDLLVGYTLVPGTAAAGSCPFGRPGDDDPVVHGTFALEGESPLVAPVAGATLSGIDPGTELAVLVAARDAAGNVSCWSAPQQVRPDEVVLTRPTTSTLPVLGGAPVVAEVEGALAVAAGSGGLFVVDRSGAQRPTDVTVATDVAAFGDGFVVAADAFGVAFVELDAAGVPSPATLVALPAGAVARAVVPRPGGALVAASDGLYLLSTGAPERLVDGDFADVAASGDLVFTVAAVDGIVEARSITALRAGDDTPRGTYLPRSTPRAVLVAGDAVFVTENALGGVVVLASADLAVRARRLLPGGAAPTALAAFDDLVVVGGDDGSVYALDDDGRLRGRTTVAATAVQAVSVGSLKVCALTSNGATSTRTCVTSAQAPLAREAARFGAGDVFRVADSGGLLFALNRNGAFAVTDHAGSVRATGAATGNVVVAAVPGIGFLVDGVVVRTDGVVVEAGEVVDALALDGAAGFGAVSGDRVVLAGVSSVDGAAALVTGRLVEGAASFSLEGVERTALPGVTQVASVVLHHGRAYVATSPFGLLSVDEDGGALAVEVADDDGGDLADVAFVDDDGSERVLVAGEREVGGVALRRVFAVSGGVVDDDGVLAPPGGRLRGMTAVGRFLVLSTADAGALVVDVEPGLRLRTVVQLPGLAGVGQVIPTARGFLAADGDGGAVYVTLR